MSESMTVEQAMAQAADAKRWVENGLYADNKLAIASVVLADGLNAQMANSRFHEANHCAAEKEIEALQARVAELEAICENVPEGCTPADAMVLREANHKLADEVEIQKEHVKKVAALAEANADLCDRVTKERDDALRYKARWQNSRLPDLESTECLHGFNDAGHRLCGSREAVLHFNAEYAGLRQERDGLAAKCAELDDKRKSLCVELEELRGRHQRECSELQRKACTDEYVRRIKADAVREWLDDVIAMLVNSHEMTTHRGMTHVAIDHLREHLPQHEANQIEREGGV